MKHLHKKLIVVICIGLMLAPSAPLSVPAQKGPDDGKKVFDSYATVTTMIYPPAGTTFKVAGEMLELFGYFGSVDPVGEAIQRINQRLDILERRVSDLEARVRAVENELFQTQNLNRVRLLRDKQGRLKLLLYKLRQKPTEKLDRLALAKEAQIIADGFLDDPDLWKWSDMREKDGNMLPADFKPLPALEYYVVSLVTWMAAIDNATDGDYEFVKREYGKELQKHIDYLSVRSGWKEGDGAVTLPENIKSRISCTMELLHRSPHSGKCSIHEGCEDRLARVLSTVKVHEVFMPQGTELCNVLPTMSSWASENELEQMYGTEVMAKLAEKLDLLKTSGTARDAYPGKFDPSTQTAQFLYTVKPNGDLLWYMHRVISRKPGTGGLSPADRAKEYDKYSSQSTTPASGSGTAKLDPRITRASKREPVAKIEVTHEREGPKQVGVGWEGFKQVFSGGGGIIYAMREDGKLFWYKHNNYHDGKGLSSAGAWVGPREVGSEWTQFKRVFPAGDGIIYVVAEDNRLKWLRHIDYANGAKAWEGPKDVGGPQWGGYKHVFATGGGVIYAITDDGSLLWHREIDYQQGVKNWVGPKVVGSGWHNFKDVFSAGEGVIYAVTDDGHVLWYKHNGYKDGSVSWQGPVSIAADWNDFLFIFPNMTQTWTQPVVR